MATLTPTLTLTSTAAFPGQNISLSVTDTLSVTAPYTDISKMATNDDKGDGAGVIIAESTDQFFVYIKNTGFRSDNTTATSADFVTVTDVDGTAGVTIKLFPGEFAFFPMKEGDGSAGSGGDGGLKATKGGSNEVFIEYAFFKRTV